MSAPPRSIVIGDIHGCSLALKAIIAAIDVQAEDTIITLGDYVDRGPDSKGVLDHLIDLERRCHLIALKGDHDEMLRTTRASGLTNRPLFDFWIASGGNATIVSYESAGCTVLPPEHVAFLERLRLYHETNSHIFVHANYVPNQPVAKQSPDTLLRLRLEKLPGPHYSKKTVVVGHTRQKDGAILDVGYLKCIDTGCGFGGPLTALDVDSGKVWQAAEKGEQLAVSSDRMARFERCPRCDKTWGMFAVYCCPSCGLRFCAGCDLDDPGSQDLRWLTAAAAEARVNCCPACTVVITDSDKIGVIVGRDKRGRS
jgi:serine/threonine protein phosphatase 1